MRFFVFFLATFELLAFNVTTVTENEPSSLVEGVSVVTGDFCLHVPTYTVQGAEPIRLSYTYVSEGWIFTGYEHYSATWLEGKIFIREPYGTNILYSLGNTKRPNHIGEYFYGDPKKKKYWKAYTLTSDDFIRQALGISNTASGDISARTHIKNHRIVFDPNRDKEGKSFSFHAADGAVRCYTKAVRQVKAKIPGSGIFKDKEYYPTYNYLLFKEDLPNGHTLRYVRYGDELVEMQATNRSGSKVFASVKIPSASINEVYMGSDGLSASVHSGYVKEAKKNMLQKISLPHGPDLALSWTAKQMINNKNKYYQAPFLDSFSLPDRRSVHIHYDMGDQKTKPKVFLLKSPVGKDEELFVTHRFIYGRNNTDVFDLEGNKTTYHWNDEGRLTSIRHFKGADAFYSEERFKWNHTLLTSRSFWDSEGICKSARAFVYDDHGNVQESYFCGDLRGKEGKVYFKLNGSIDLEQSEAFITKSSYSQDARHLPLRIEESSGLITLYTYVPETNLVKTKTLCDGETPKIIFTYEYDEDCLLIKETIDDGVCQKIKRIFPKQTQPFLGMPEIIEERYRQGFEEKLLKRKVLHYRKGAQIECEEIFDAEENFCYVLHYEYDEKKRLIKQTNPMGLVSLAQYDRLGNRILTQDFGSLASETFEYDFSNRPIRKIVKDLGRERVFEYSYDKKHRLEWESDERGHQTHYKYDFLGRCIETTEPPIITDKGDLSYPTIKRSYDLFGHETLRIDPRGFETKAAYSVHGKPTWILHPDGTEEFFTYTLKGDLESHLTAGGIKTVYERDYLGRTVEKKIFENGHLLSEEKFLYTGYLLTGQIDAEGNKTLYEYDGAGRKISETFAGETNFYHYDALGRIYKIESGGEITYKTYDLLDRVIEERKESFSGQVLQKTLYSYNSQGDQTEVIRFIQGSLAKEVFVYDSLHRVIQKIDPLGHIETFSYEDVWDEYGQKVLQKIHTDALGLQTIEIFDPQGNLQSLEKRKEKTLFLSKKFYTLSKKLFSQIDRVFAPNGSQREVRTCWEYDSMGRETALIEAAGTAEEKITRKTYTPAGDLETASKPDGTLIFYEYNGLKQLLSIRSSDGSVDHKMSYNRLGHLQQTDQIQRLTDPKGRLLSESFFSAYSTENIFDEWGRKVHFNIPSIDLFISYSYQGGYLQKISRLNRQGELYSHEYLERDLSGKSLKERLIDGKSIKTQNFDLCSRKISISSPFFCQNIEAFDPVGNLLSMVRQGEKRSYHYDDLYQLIEETGRFKHVYSYDSLHNRLTKDDELYEINALHQVASHLVYNSNGCPIQAKEVKFVYDALDRLVEVVAPNYSQRFSYDSLHRCLSKTTAQNGQIAVEYFLYDGQKEIGSLTKDFELKELRILGQTPHAELGASIALELNGEIFIPVHDLQNNIAFLSSLDGSAFTELDYSAFGEEISKGSIASPWSFSSKRRDKKSGLVYYGRRFYTPSLGRWLTPDPSGFTDGMNLYAFVGNEPLMHFDEYGLWLQRQAPGSFNSSEIVNHWKNDFMMTWNNPRFQGGVQTFGGLGEIYAGSYLACSPASLLGFAVMAHGADHFITGGYSLFTGRPRTTFTEQLMQKMGMSSDWASMGNGMFSLLGSYGSIGLARHFAFQNSRAAAQMAMSSYQSNQPILSGQKTVNAFFSEGGAYNRATFERYNVQLRAAMEKPFVVDSELRRIVERIYKPRSSIGSGSTAAAIRHELQTGEKVFDRMHSQKGEELITTLEKWLRNNSAAKLGDRAAAENIIKDLEDALRK